MLGPFGVQGLENSEGRCMQSLDCPLPTLTVEVDGLCVCSFVPICPEHLIEMYRRHLEMSWAHPCNHSPEHSGCVEKCFGVWV